MQDLKQKSKINKLLKCISGSRMKCRERGVKMRVNFSELWVMKFVEANWDSWSIIYREWVMAS